MNFSLSTYGGEGLLEQMLSQMENTRNSREISFASCRQFFKAIGSTQAMASV